MKTLYKRKKNLEERVGMSSGVELLHTIVSVLLKYLLSHLTVPQKTRNLKSTFISTSFGSCEFSGVCKTDKKKKPGGTV